MYAVVTSGGKQYRVEPGLTLLVERVAADEGGSVTFDQVLLVGDGDDITVGQPTVGGARVIGTVLGDALGPKVVVYKFKQKVKYRRRTGHRQHLSRIRIDEISAGGKVARVEALEPAATQAKRTRAARGTKRSTAKAGPSRKTTATAPRKAPRKASSKAAGAGTKTSSTKTGKMPKTKQAAKAPTRRRSTRKSDG